MTPDHESSEDSDAASATSTIVYDHEPFSTFQSRVLHFAQSQIWPDASQQDLTVDRMAGGGFNRIIGLRREASGAEGDDGTEYILRIPRFDAAQVDRDAAALQFVKHYTSIPAPSIIKFDDSEANELGSPFMVQTRLRGVSLFTNYQAMSHDAKCSVARQLGDIFRQMVSVESCTAGTLVYSDDDKRLDAAIYVHPIETVDVSNSSPVKYGTSPTSISTRLLMVNAFQSQKARCLRRSASESTELQDNFCAMASEMEAEGWLNKENYSLAHLDLAPHNILVSVKDEAESSCSITGVLDWDSAVLGPKFMSCKPPMWLWAWNDADEEDERSANEEPTNPEFRQVKHVFEDAAGRDYLRYAYEPAYRLARRLFQFALQDVRSNEDFREAEEMLKEWAALYKDKPGAQNADLTQTH